MITKSKAKAILVTYINKQIEMDGRFYLPITDIIVKRTVSFDVEETLSVLTFKGLLCIAYDLEPVKTEDK
jgi:hypothetical protein